MKTEKQVKTEMTKINRKLSKLSKEMKNSKLSKLEYSAKSNEFTLLYEQYQALEWVLT